MTTQTEKRRAQVKSRFYYLFWGAATVSVFAGQLYVGSGYRQMAASFNRIMDAIVVEVETRKNPFYDMEGLDCSPSVEYHDL